LNDQTHRVSNSDDDTERIGEELSGLLQPGDVVLLEGDLAAGKTTLVRGLARGLEGEPELVNSPSFVLLQTYHCRSSRIIRLHHVDLYRIADLVPELREIGLEEVLSDTQAVVAVEWPKETLATWIPPEARVWRIRLTIGAGDQREIEVSPP
jgi:tRNA threonylcarbamoyl adenosine modification protein YjeE